MTAPGKSYRLGIDVGGTKIEGIVLDENGGECFRRRIPTESDRGYQAIIDNIMRLYGEMASHIGNASHTVGIGMPGSPSPQTGLMRTANPACMNEKPARQDLEKSIGRKITLQNDANCFALAEALCGAGRGRDLVFGVTIGTGCGGGIVYRGRLIDGLRGRAGEWGHMSLDPQGPVCSCGRRGCVQALISGTALERQYEHACGRTQALKDIVEEYRQGGREAGQVIGGLFRNFGRAVANLIDILDPDIVVIGGSVATIDEIYTEGVAEAATHMLGGHLETPIVKYELGESAGVIGAAMIGEGEDTDDVQTKALAGHNDI
jgi:fructokinase